MFCACGAWQPHFPQPVYRLSPIKSTWAGTHWRDNRTCCTARQRRSLSSEASITESDDLRPTIVFTVRQSADDVYWANRISWSATIVGERAVTSLWRPWLAKPSLWKWSPQTLLKMWRPRFRIKKAFPQTSSVLSLLASSWRMAALCLTTTSRRSPLSTWCCVSVVAAHFRLF